METHNDSPKYVYYCQAKYAMNLITGATDFIMKLWKAIIEAVTENYQVLTFLIR